MPFFRKKPVIIEAICNDSDQSVADFLGEANRNIGWSRNASTGQVSLVTLEGVMRAEPFDMIIKGVKGEVYPCKPDIFAATYEPVEPPTYDNEGGWA